MNDERLVERGLGLSDFLRVPTSATTQTNIPPFETLMLTDHPGVLDWTSSG